MNFIVQTHCQCDGVKVIFVDENRFDSIEQKEELLKYGFKVESESAFLLQNINTIFVGIKSFDADDIRHPCYPYRR